MLGKTFTAACFKGFKVRYHWFAQYLLRCEAVCHCWIHRNKVTLLFKVFSCYKETHFNIYEARIDVFRRTFHYQCVQLHLLLSSGQIIHILNTSLPPTLSSQVCVHHTQTHTHTYSAYYLSAWLLSSILHVC